MNSFFKKNGFVGGITIVVIVAAIVVILWNKLISNRRGSESMQNSMYGPAANGNPNMKQFQQVHNENKAERQREKNKYERNELLPNDSNNEWAALNPTGSGGELSNINLLKAGYNIGIDTVGQSLKNANLQLRSEPPNPQLNVGPWNQSTITPDFMRVPLEIGQGYQ